jgi:hypothetical protein
MHTHRFGRKLKLPSTMAIKHGILSMMVQDELKAQTLAAEADEILVAHGRGGAEPLNGVQPWAGWAAFDRRQTQSSLSWVLTQTDVNEPAADIGQHLVLR